MSSPNHSEGSLKDELVQPVDFHELTANHSGPGIQKGAAQFTSTHWSIVVEAQGESPAAQEALENLCRIYWRPIYSFVQRQGTAPEEAEDVTQAFFADLIEHKSMINFDNLTPLYPDERLKMEPTDPVTAEQIYERRWASTVLERVLSLLKDEYVAAGNAALFDFLKQLLPDEPGSPTQADIAGQLGMTANAVRQAFHRFRQRYQSLLREEIAHTVATPGDVEDELRHLIAVVRA